MEAQSEAISDKELSTTISLAIYFFWFGFLIYSLSYTISTSDSVNYIYCQIIQIMALLVFVPSAIILIRWRFDTTYLSIIYLIYIVWSLTVIVRGFMFDYKYIKFLLFDSGFGIFLYFAPLVLLLPRELIYYRTIFDVIVVLSLAYLVFDVVFRNELLYLGRNIKSQTIMEYFSQNLSLQSGFLLLTYKYHSKKRIFLALLVLILTFLLAAIRARRTLMFMSLSILTFSFFIYYYNQKVRLLVFVLSAILISAIYIIGAKIYNDNSSGVFRYVTDRFDEKTRSGVESYFYNDMNTTNWLIGKGINGDYYCPGIGETGFLTIKRGVIETGYLQIILKGGIVNLLLLLLIAVPALIKGLFLSSNTLSKASGLWILLFLIDLYPLSPTAFSMNYLLVWISIGICYSKKIRDTPESMVIKTFAK